jgi:dTDP-4-amino-4,6-dideoxygalactose transaminase
MKKIPFNKPYFTGKEMEYIHQVISYKHISGNGSFTKRCQELLRSKFLFNHCLLTTSCTDALEMAAILCNIVPGDEVILPSYTFVSTANPFVLRGARLVFADSCKTNPNMDVFQIEKLITKKTKAVIPVHYGGVACEMDKLMDLSRIHGFKVIEDAAQSLDSYYKGKPLGGIGHLGAFSFHETKNIISGEGGALIVNDHHLYNRSDIVWEKGTNRSAFLRGEVNKYGWVDVGSSFLPAEIIAAFLFAQLEQMSTILEKRQRLWKYYNDSFSTIQNNGYFELPFVPDYATVNGHIFYLLCNNQDERNGLIAWLKKKGIQASFHYLSLHDSIYYQDKHDGRLLPNAVHFTHCLVRLPLYYELTRKEIDYIVQATMGFYKNNFPI